MWRVIAFYGPLWTSFLVVVFLYWRVTSTINLYAKANKKDKVAATKLKKLAQSVRGSVVAAHSATQPSNSPILQPPLNPTSTPQLPPRHRIRSSVCTRSSSCVPGP